MYVCVYEWKRKLMDLLAVKDGVGSKVKKAVQKAFMM